MAQANAVNVSKLNSYTVLDPPEEVSKLNAYAVLDTPQVVSVLNLYAVVEPTTGPVRRRPIYGVT